MVPVPLPSKAALQATGLAPFTTPPQGWILRSTTLLQLPDRPPAPAIEALLPQLLNFAPAVWMAYADPTNKNAVYVVYFGPLAKGKSIHLMGVQSIRHGVNVHTISGQNVRIIDTAPPVGTPAVQVVNDINGAAVTLPKVMTGQDSRHELHFDGERCVLVVFTDRQLMTGSSTLSTCPPDAMSGT
jgi:hypothetical protein